MQHPHALLDWHLACGVDEALDDVASNRLQLAPLSPVAAPVAVDAPLRPVLAAATVAPLPPAPQALLPTGHWSEDARKLAAAANTLAELQAAVENFDGCALKKGAQKTVYADGNREGDILVIGEAPGADEDRQGIPFCGASGKLLDKMLESIGIGRESRSMITNMIYWRPPGNRTPSPEEISICLPFVERTIHLFQPKLIILAGASPAGGLLGEKRGITRIRGQKFDYKTSYSDQTYPVIPMFHPSYLLRSPEMKRFSWQDLLTIREQYL